MSRALYPKRDTPLYDLFMKSPSLTVIESWLLTVVSIAVLAVSKTMCFMNNPKACCWHD